MRLRVLGGYSGGRLMLLLLCLAVPSILACRQAVEGPDTFPVRGKVIFTKGGTAKDLADHSIYLQFQSVEQPEVIATGEILEDGSFTMATQLGVKGKPGAVRGRHRVRLNADESSVRYIAPKFLSYDTSGIQVSVPAEGDLEIKVWR